jgi:hypothetical protein
VSIESIGLGQKAFGLGEIPYLAGVDGHGWEFGRDKLGQDTALEATGGFKNNQGGVQSRQLLGEGADAVCLVGGRPCSTSREDVHVQGCL